METAIALVLIVCAVMFVSAIAERFRISPPLLLIGGGIAMAGLLKLFTTVTGVHGPDYELSPELVLVGILPPLLYSAAYETSFVDFRANRRALVSLSVGLVLFTTVVVGFVAHAIMPGIPLAACFALGAIVAPPDAVAATAVARRVGMPRRIVQILEGESLVNDATALTTLRAAVAVAAGGAATFSFFEFSLSFIYTAAAGVAVGLVIAFIYIKIRFRFEVSNTSIGSLLTFVVPYIAYIPAEEAGASGVLAVVAAGLVIGHKSPRLLSGAGRLTSESNWRMVSFLLENLVFLMIGLQLPEIIGAVQEQVDGGELSWVKVIVLAAAVFVACVAARVVWVFADGFVSRTNIPGLRFPAGAPSNRVLAVVGWCGMRGVVTLAGALSLYASNVEGTAVIVLVAFVVVVGSIVVLGQSLPWLVKRLQLQGPNPAEDALEEAALLDEAMRAGRVRLEEIRMGDEPEAIMTRLRLVTDDRSNAAWERIKRGGPDAETPVETYCRLRLQMIDAERDAVIAARDERRTSDDVMRRVIRTLDVEQSMLEAPHTTAEDSTRELITPVAAIGECLHLQAALSDVEPVTPGACEDCLREGTTWVHLRKCLQCGHVGCCDSSAMKHATAHYESKGHPVMQSSELGESWRWCFVDELLG